MSRCGHTRNVFDGDGERDQECSPSTAAATTEATIERGTLRKGFCGLFCEIRRGVEPDERGEAHDHPGHTPPPMAK